MLIAAFVVGLAVWMAATSSVMKTLVVPRGSSGLNHLKNEVLGRSFRAVARRTRTYEARDRILTYQAPTAIVSSLIMWLLMYFLAYGLMMYAFTPLSLWPAFREAGSSLFTLGYATSDRAGLTTLDFIAAATGPIVIGLLIGYLPTMYSAYQGREAEATLLLARGGEPNWAPELIRRHALVNNVEALDTLWPVWERWAAEVGENHTNFPVLIHMRSARPHRNWLVSLVVVMDAAAMHMSLNPQLPQGGMRIALRQGIVCLQELCRVERITFDPDPLPDKPSSVSLSDFEDACALIGRAGYTWTRDPAEAYRHFRGWRANYEEQAYALLDEIDAVPAPWTGDRTPALPVIWPDTQPNRSPDRPEGGSG
ncbi:MAG: hypothetical protein MUF33_08230 [Candidatus Nanopelagicales bacterium]|nr:hypothetical protein [Candidatus Nanopelagicales bacterium]MCU0295698.1 hypothetical protein [Candidatus Nanopelagicales bacterium]MCU0298491.1 hypothetical protein [Candidatus Nanopelagicales bacterium]